MSSIDGTRISVQTTIKQSTAPGADDLYQLSVSTLVLSGTSCISSGDTIIGEIAGTAATIDIGDPLEIGFVAEGKDVSMNTLSVGYSAISGPCNGDTGLGTLTKQ